MNRLKVAIVHPQLTGVGGSELRPLWIAEALKMDFFVTLITMGTFDLDRLNAYCGTKIDRDQIKIIAIPVPPLLRTRFDALRDYPLSRYCRKISSDFDIMISTYGLMDFGQPGIQFIADFSFDDELRRKFDSDERNPQQWAYRASVIRKAYLALARRLHGVKPNAWQKNVTIANSRWTRKVFADKYGILSQVIYPPVPGLFPSVPWMKKENGFIYIGRISPEKSIDEIIRILMGVKARGHRIHLHIYGRLDDTPYVRYIQRLQGQNRDWILLEGLIVGDEKRKVMSAHKFGISGRRAEPFGISAAELVKAGCLVWVPNGGGQVEIVDAPELTYNSCDDAIEKICHVLESKNLQLRLRRHLQLRSRRFSSEAFVSDIHKVVDVFLKTQDVRKK